MSSTIKSANLQFPSLITQDNSHVFFQKDWPTCFCSPFLALEKLQQQVVANPKSTLGVHTFFWRMESYHNHHPHKGLVAWLEPWKWALGKGLIYNPSFFCWIVLLITYNHGLGIYTHNPGIDFTDCKNLPVDPSFIKKKGIKGHRPYWNKQEDETSLIISKP